MKIKIEHIILSVLILLLANEITGGFKSVGMSKKEHELEIKIHDLNQEKELLLEGNIKLEIKLKSFENEVIKNDSIIHNSTTEQLDSMFTEYFQKR